MSARPLAGLALALVAGVCATAISISSQQATAIDVAIFQDLTWRSLGPFRAGRTTAAAMSAAEPGVFYTGVEGAGLWKTTDDGRTWKSVFEAPPYGSVGAIVVSPSQPAIVYVGTGEAESSVATTVGSGVYKSTNSGRTWSAVGLSTTQRIAAIAIDPQDANRLWVAVQGRSVGRSSDGGVYRSINGGLDFNRVLFVDEATGAMDVSIDPQNRSVVYATFASSGGGAGLFKSTDGGTTWRRLSTGLPAATDVRHVTLAIAPTDSRRLGASVSARVGSGLYRSDDSGETWARVNADETVSPPNGPPARIAIDPSRPDNWTVVHGDVWTSTDGGATLRRWMRQPRDRDHTILLQSATSPDVKLLAGSHGAIITMNDGESWSSPWTQPTAAITHVSTDSSFPYRVCGSQAYSGPLCVPSRVEPDRLGLPQWQSLPFAGSGAVAADPSDPDVVYGGALSRFDRRTLVLQDIGPVGGEPPITDAPLAFSTDGRTLFFANQSVWKSTTSAVTWTNIGPNLPRDAAVAGAIRPTVSRLAVSSLDPRVLWIASTNGIVQATRDGGATWTSVAPPGVTAETSILSLEASRFDANSAYLSIWPAGTGSAPQLLRTRDFGATWTPLPIGAADGDRVAVVREDPFRRGLLFAGTDRSIALSFDDGDSWQSLRMNLPITPITDITIRDATVIVATAGRGFWALDDISPLRQMTGDIARAPAFLFRPAPVWRMRAVAEVPPGGDAPAPEVAPDGATLPYLIGPGARGVVTLEIIETGTATVIRQFTGGAGLAQPNQLPPGQVPLDGRSGLHHVVWDLRYTTAEGLGRGPQVAPGSYQVRLTVNGRPLRQAIVVRIDPRVKAVATDLSAQVKLASALNAKILQVDQALRTATSPSPADQARGLSLVLAALAELAGRVQQADVRPSAALEAASADAMSHADALLESAR